VGRDIIYHSKTNRTLKCVEYWVYHSRLLCPDMPSQPFLISVGISCCHIYCRMLSSLRENDFVFAGCNVSTPNMLPSSRSKKGVSYVPPISKLLTQELLAKAMCCNAIECLAPRIGVQ